MHDLIAITSLGGITAQIDSFAGLEISEQPNWALASISARRGQIIAVQAAAVTLLGTKLPDVGQSASGNAMTVFWIGPDQWMAEADLSSHENLASILKMSFQASASITEQTDGWARFDVKGPHLVALFERLCPLRIKTMTSGDSSRTAIDHLSCFVICRIPSQHVSVLCPRSGTASLHHTLCITAASLG